MSVELRSSGRRGTGRPGHPGHPGHPGRSGRTRPSPYARRATPLPPTFGQRSADRVTLAAGIVLGAAVLIGLQAVRRALGTARDAVRG